MKQEKLIEWILDDLFEIANNLEDDMELDLHKGESGYKSYEDSYEALEKNTMNIIAEKVNKWRQIQTRCIR